MAAGSTTTTSRPISTESACGTEAGVPETALPPSVFWAHGDHRQATRRRPRRILRGRGGRPGVARGRRRCTDGRRRGALARPDRARARRRGTSEPRGGAVDDPPARIHGDLWNGNVLWSADGVVLIDPAAHGGHRETDLAMLALFGCPFLDDVLGAYHRAAPLRAGWRERVALHQLHPLAVHAAGHGRGYGVALAEAAEVVLELVGRTRE
ncbi:fructosamine kinase family protein [Streptomyces sp. ISL-90]|nr:fructosamine kinase family protein [Streptomyces sp. ISL-90]